MNNQEFDELLREKLGAPHQPPGHVWDKINKALDESDDRSVRKAPFWNVYRGIAAGIALLAVVGTAAYMFNSENKKKQQESHAVAEHHQAAPEKDIRKTDEVAGNTATENNSAEEQVYAAGKQYPRQTGTRQSITITNPTVLIDSTDTKQSVTISPVKDKTVISPQLPETDNKISDNPFPKDKPGTDLIAKTYPDERRITRKNDDMGNNSLMLGVSGGYNFGTLNNGASLAINTRKQINSKMFVDGAVGLVMNNADESVASFDGNYLQHQKVMRTANAVAKPSVNPFSTANAFYYLQINPTIGYSINNKIDISAGPDYQQMISNTDKDVVQFSDNKTAKLLPKNDFGITGKAEFQIAPNLRAGITFREGMTSLIRNDNDISNRRYMQLQLKFQLPVKD